MKEDQFDLEDEIQQFIHDNYYNLVLNCHRDMADIMYAVRDFYNHKTKNDKR